MLFLYFVTYIMTLAFKVIISDHFYHRPSLSSSPSSSSSSLSSSIEMLEQICRKSGLFNPIQSNFMLLISSQLDSISSQIFVFVSHLYLYDVYVFVSKCCITFSLMFVFVSEFVSEFEKEPFQPVPIQLHASDFIST